MSRILNLSLRWRLFLLVMLAALPLLGLVLYNAALQRQHELSSVGQNAQSAAALAASDIAQRLNGQRQLLVALAQLPDVISRQPAGCSAAASRLMGNVSSYVNIGAADPAGVVFCSAIALTQTTTVSQRDWFRESVATGDFALGDYQYSPRTGRPIVVGAYPVRDAAGAVQAVVFAALDLTQLSAVGQAAGLPADATITVIDSTGTILSRFPDPSPWIGQHLPDDPLVKIALLQPAGTTQIAGTDGIERLYGLATAASPVAGLHVAVGIPTAVAYQEVNTTLMRSWIGLGLLTIIILATTRLAADAFVLHPLANLLTVTRQFGAGQLDSRSQGPYRAGEIDELAVSFDKMAAAIQQREAQLEQTNHILKTLSECNQALVRSTDELSLLAAVCHNIIAFGNYRLAWVEVLEARDPLALRIAARASAAPDVSWPAASSTSPAAAAVQAGRPVVINVADHSDAAWREYARQAGFQVIISLPMIQDGQALGALCIATAEAAGFGAAAAEMLTELCGDLAYGVSALRTRAARRQAESDLRELNANLEQRVAERTAALEREVAERTRAQAEAEDLYSSAPCGYHSLNAQGVFMRLNDYELKLFGYARDELVGKVKLRDLLTPASQEIFQQEFPRFLQTGQLRNLELSMRRRDGSEVAVLVSATAVYDAGGQFLTSRSTLIDINERKATEARIQGLNETLSQRAVELEATNHELEAFSYSVSHDLRAPLRSIDGFSLALLEDYGAQLTGSAQDYLQRVRQAAQRMATLIDDLLDLSRVTRSELRHELVELSALASGICAELQQAEPDRQVEITITPGLTAWGDSRLLGVALTNLLGNAWKFTGRSPVSRIEFGASGDDQPRTFFVRDNGAGFDMAYVQRLFGAFQRLHDQAQFPGSGVGLATVQRIIHRHGGRVWADSQPGLGATFYFTLGHRHDRQNHSPN
jgi:PAS domain S-box-containing protein